MQIRCPHCHASVDSADDVPLSDVLCPACGSGFNLVGDETIIRAAPPVDTIGHFTIVERLGSGSFGTVWKAHDADLDRTVAIKMPRKDQLDPQETEQFLREARAAARLRHPNIISIHEVGRESDTVYIVSDFVNGMTLADWLTGRRLSSRAAAELCAKLADALQHAHEAGVVHRDIKPANIMMDGAGEPHLMDFGLARRDAGEATRTAAGKVLGTPAYMPPEQARGEAHNADRRSDIYSLGVVLFELLTGQRPFQGNATMLIHQVLNDEPPLLRKIDPSVPRDLQTICLKAMAKEPERRYQAASEFAADLRRFLNGDPIRARPVKSTERAWRWCRKNPIDAGLAALAATLLIALAFSFAPKKNSQPQERPDDSLQRVIRAGKIVVATDPNYPPMEFLRDGEFAGSEIRIARRLARELGVQTEFVVVDWDWQDLVRRLNSHEFDVLLSGITVTEERSRQVDFVAYTRLPLALICKKGVIAKNERDLAGKVVAVQVDTTAHKLVVGLKRTGIDIKQIMVCTGALDPFESIVKGEADVTLAHEPVAYYLAHQYQGLAVTGLVEHSTDPIGIAFSKQDIELQKTVTKAVQRMEQDGTLAKILQEEFGE